MNSETLRCPTCRAEQPWTDTCRRCKCDLRLLREVAQEFSRRRAACLRFLHENLTGAALVQARACFDLSVDSDTHRLLAVCEFLNGNFASAVAHAGSDGSEPTPKLAGQN